MKQGAYIALANHANQLRHIGGAGFRLGRESHWRKEMHTVGVGKVTERGVAGNHAGRSGNLGQQLTDLGMGKIQLVDVAPGILTVDAFIIGVRRNQTIANIADIDPAQGEVLPGMGVILAVVMVIVVVVIMGVVVIATLLDAIRSDHQRTAIFAGFDQPFHPALELQAVKHHQVGISQRPCIARAGREHVSIAVRTHQRADFHLLAPYVSRHISQDAKAGHHLQTLGCHGGRQSQHGHSACQQSGRFCVSHIKSPRIVFSEARERPTARPFGPGVPASCDGDRTGQTAYSPRPPAE